MDLAMAHKKAQKVNSFEVVAPLVHTMANVVCTMLLVACNCILVVHPIVGAEFVAQELQEVLYATEILIMRVNDILKRSRK